MGQCAAGLSSAIDSSASHAKLASQLGRHEVIAVESAEPLPDERFQRSREHRLRPRSRPQMPTPAEGP